MPDGFLLSIVLTGFGVAFFHAAIPTHWLPFVLAGKGQGWSRQKTLAVTAIAGLGHVLFTTLLGVLVVWLGIETSQWTGNVFPFIAGGLLIAFGIYYLIRQAKNKSGHHHWGKGCDHHGHEHPDHAHDHDHSHPHPHVHDHDKTTAPLLNKSDGAVILGLFAMLTFSPCEGFLPVYLSGIQYGWGGFILLSAILALATLAGMVTFTWLTLAGIERFNLKVFEKYESGVLGALLVVLGVLLIIFE